MSNSIEDASLIDGITLPHAKDATMGYQGILGRTSIILEEGHKMIGEVLLLVLFIALALFAWYNIPRHPAPGARDGKGKRDQKGGGLERSQGPPSSSPSSSSSSSKRTLNAMPQKNTTGLVERACMDSGVSQDDAFSIDEAGVNLYERLGEAVFVSLSANFYRRVYSTEHSPDWFRAIFKGSKEEDAARNQSDFFIQRMGGPPLFSERRGHPALIRRHVGFDVTAKGAEMWLNHMQNALDSTAGIDSDSKRRMQAFFRHTAYFLVHGNAASRARATA